MKIMDETAEEGIAQTLSTYDRYDHKVEVHYFDTEGASIDGPEGCSMVTME